MTDTPISERFQFLAQQRQARRVQIPAAGRPDMVNHPPHYGGFSHGAEVIDITEHLTFNAGNALKYLARAGRTDGENKGEMLEDLRKAEWYVKREIARLETGTDSP